MTVAVGQRWHANVAGKVQGVKRAEVELVWVSSDGSVVEGVVRSRRKRQKVTLARCLLLERKDKNATRGAVPRDGASTGPGSPPLSQPPRPARSATRDPEPDSHLGARIDAAIEAQLGIFAPKAEPGQPKPKRKRRKPRKRLRKALKQWPEPEGPPRERDATPEEARLAKAIRLRPYQLEGAAWLAKRRSGILADEPGVGKTAQIMAAIPPKAPVLILCPSVARDGVWPRHVGWRPDLQSRVVERRRDWALPAEGEVVIATYDALPPELAQGGVELAWGTIVVLDEAHLAKNPKAQRSKRTLGLCKAARKYGGATWLVTGSPLKNTPTDLWSLLVVAGLGERTWKTRARFERAFGRDPYTGDWTGKIEPDVPDRLRRVMLRREFAEVVPDMPPRQWERVRVSIPESVAEVADAVVEALAAAGVDLEEATAESLRDAKRNKAAGDFMKARALLAAAKVPALIELVEAHEAESDRPLVVFSAHVAPLKALEQRKGWAKVTGAESSRRRAELEEEFQAGKLKGLAITIGPVSTAISLSRARRAIFVDRGWTPSDNEQAEGRVYRADEQTLGTSEPVLYTLLVADHAIDYRLAQLLATKREQAAASVGASAVGVGRAGDLLPVQPKETRQFAATLGAESVDSPQGFPTTLEPGRRHAGCPLEFWAEDALGKLAESPVSALERPFFVAVAEEIGRGLTDQRWRALVRACRRYVRSVGAPPTAA